MKKLIYGTGNPAKLQSMRNALAPLNIEIIGLKEIEIDVPEVHKNGNSPVENARIKALAYYKVFKTPVFACDSGLYIDGLNEEEQPGVHVRVINGKRLNDDEMIDHYCAIAKRLGGKAVAQYKNAICLVINEKEIYEHFGSDISSEKFCFTDKPHPKQTEGFPLDCISVHIESGEYYYWHRPNSVVGMMNEGFRDFFRKVAMIRHYNSIIDEIDNPSEWKVVDSFRDTEPLKSYMDKWDDNVFIEDMGLSPSKTVLEIGLGTGRLAVRVCDKCMCFTGIDISPKTINRASANLSKFNNVNLICADFLSYSFEETFDIIYSSLTFLHIKDKQAAIKKQLIY